MLHIPHDIWLHIAHFIPALVLQNLLSLNSTFFDIAMDSRYRQISFAFLDSRMLRSLVRLKDPAVAKRVRVLHIYPGFMNEVLSKGKDDSASKRTFLYKISEAANNLLDQKLFGKPSKLQLVRQFKSTDDLVHALLDVLAGLTNVTDYHIMWCGLPAIHKSPAPFLTAVFQSNLRKLSLEVSLENVESLLTPTSAMHKLEELDIILRIDHLTFCASTHRAIMVDHLAPAVNRLRSTLQTLSIQAWEPLNLSPFFDSMGYMPFLDKLTIAVPVESPHLGDPAGLRNFLNCHSETLRCLVLRATQYSGVGMTPDVASIDEWIKTVFANVHLVNLRALEMSSGLLPIGTAIVCLRRFATSITTLSLTGRYHSYTDIEKVLGCFARRPDDERLETLRLGPVTLTPQLIDLLAEKLPRLYKLELFVREVLPHEGELPILYSGHRNIYSQVETQIDTFFTEMEMRTYPLWCLRYITIMVTSYPSRIGTESHLEQLFAQCVPTIRLT